VFAFSFTESEVRTGTGPSVLVVTGWLEAVGYAVLFYLFVEVLGAGADVVVFDGEVWHNIIVVKFPR